MNLKTDVPFEQSVTELAVAFRIARVATSAVKRVIITYGGDSLDGVSFVCAPFSSFLYYYFAVSWPIFLEPQEL